MTERFTYDAPLSNVKTGPSGKGIFEAYASVFGNIDSHRERVVPGAFQKSLAAWKAAGKRIPLLWSHKFDDLDAHLGEIVEAREDDHGLWVKGQLDLEEPMAARIYKKMRRRLLTEFSFAFGVKDARRAEDGYRELLELDVYEISIVFKGANEQTELLTVKSEASTTPRLDQARAALRQGWPTKPKRLYEVLQSLD
jgi:HK97 family phage prohead protease